jgi:16S rRNA processing protein RimM
VIVGDRGRPPESEDTPDPELLAVGRITKAHGVRGEVAVMTLSEVGSRFEPGSVLHLEDGRTLTVSGSRPHGNRLLVRFEEVADRTRAETLRGEVLLVSSAATPSPPEGAYWVHQVVGMEVVTEEGRGLGRIAEVLHNPGNDVWVTRDGDREGLIPAVREVVLDVDLEAGRVKIRPIEGLLP